MSGPQRPALSKQRAGSRLGDPRLGREHDLEPRAVRLGLPVLDSSLVRLRIRLGDRQAQPGSGAARARCVAPAETLEQRRPELDDVRNGITQRDITRLGGDLTKELLLPARAQSPAATLPMSGPGRQ